MSFKDVRDLAEQLKLLAFPRILALQSLATFHGSLGAFHIVAEILQWLAGMLEPGALLAGSVQSEEDRVTLIRSATEFFVTKCAVRLNPRKLYAASAVTAAELQKITQLLIAPEQASVDERYEEEQQQQQQFGSLKQVDIGDKINELRRARELSSELTQRGAIVHGLLKKEFFKVQTGLSKTQRPLELQGVERLLKNAIAATLLKLQSSRAQLETSRVEFNAFNSKLQRKRAELERTKQRLEALQKIRPVHKQEFEDCENELQELFQRYFLYVHMRDALRILVESRTKYTINSPLLRQSTDMNSIHIIPDGLLNDDDDENINDSGARTSALLLGPEAQDLRDGDFLLNQIGKRPRTTTTRPVRSITGRNPKLKKSDVSSTNTVVDGSSVAIDEDSSFGSSESDFDMGDIINMTGGGTVGEGDDDFDLNSIDDISISKLTGELPLRPKTASKPEHLSDEDF